MPPPIVPSWTPALQPMHGDWSFGTFKMLMDERAQHSAAMADAEHRFAAERDRRYTEVQIEREKALQIKEVADAKALVLAAALQAEKDERKNDVLSRWDADRNTFVTRTEFVTAIDTLGERFSLALKPLNDFMAGTRQAGSALAMFKTSQIAYVTLAVVIAGVLSGLFVKFVL